MNVILVVNQSLIFIFNTKDLVATTIEGDMIPRLIDEIPILALLAHVQKDNSH